MSVTIPMVDPGVPQQGYIGGPASSDIFQSMAEKANYLHGNHFIRVRNIIVQPFRTIKEQTVGSDELRHIPFKTSSGCKGLFVALAVTNVKVDGMVKVLVREAPTVVSGVGVAGSGALVDPGCQWLQATQTLPEPVVGGRWAVPYGPLWLHTGVFAPPEVDLMGGPSPVPRTLTAPGAQELELELSWDEVALNTVCIIEYFQERR